MGPAVPLSARDPNFRLEIGKAADFGFADEPHARLLLGGEHPLVALVHGLVVDAAFEWNSSPRSCLAVDFSICPRNFALIFRS